MAWPIRRPFTCPVCADDFEDETPGRHETRSFDPDLRERGSIEAVRRYLLTTCPSCLYTDYHWDFALGSIGPEQKKSLAKRLQGLGISKKGYRPIPPLDRFRLAKEAFAERQLDPAAQAELCVQAYYVASDLDLDPDVQADWRDQAAAGFQRVLMDEPDLGAPLQVRYSHLLGELSRRSGNTQAARQGFEDAIEASREAAAIDGAFEDDLGPTPASSTIANDGTAAATTPVAAAAAPSRTRLGDSTLSTREIAHFSALGLARLRWERATLRTLHDKILSDNTEEAGLARLLIAERRDAATLSLLPELFDDSPVSGRLAILESLVNDPPATLMGLYRTALESDDPDQVNLAARCVARVADPQALDPLLGALDRHREQVVEAVCSTLKRISHPDLFSRVHGILVKWTSERANANQAADTAEGNAHSRSASSLATASTDQQRRPASGRLALARTTDLLREVVYVDESQAALDLMLADLEALGGTNDLWEKPPSYSPVPFLLRRGQEICPQLQGLLSSSNPVARRWAARCLGELGDQGVVEGLQALLSDTDLPVRLEAARALGLLGHPDQAEDVVLRELDALEDDFPFALHFLVPFRSHKVRDFLVAALDSGKANPSEVMPMLGRHEKLPAKLLKRIRKSLDTSDEEERAGAVTALSFAAPDDIAQQLLSLYDQETDMVRRRIVYALGRLVRDGEATHKQVLPLLRQSLKQDGADVAFAAAVALLQLGDSAGLELARERAEAALAAGGDDYDLAIPALRALEAFSWADEQAD